METSTKFAIGAASAAGGGGALAVGLTLNNNSSTEVSTEKKTDTPKPKSEPNDVLNLDKLEELGPCIKENFGNFELKEVEGTSKTTPYKVFTETTDSLAKGCLIVNWKKKTNNSETPTAKGWWKGILRWEWALLKGNEGFVFSGRATNAKEDKSKVDVQVKLAALKKEKDNWVVKYYFDVENKNITSDTEETKLPRGIRDTEYKKENQNQIDPVKKSWGFAPDISKSCKFDPGDDANCKFDLNNNPVTYKKRWNWLEKKNTDPSGTRAFSYMHSNFTTFWKDYETKVDLKSVPEALGIWN